MGQIGCGTGQFGRPAGRAVIACRAWGLKHGVPHTISVCLQVRPECGPATDDLERPESHYRARGLGRAVGAGESAGGGAGRATWRYGWIWAWAYGRLAAWGLVGGILGGPGAMPRAGPERPDQGGTRAGRYPVAALGGGGSLAAHLGAFWTAL